MPLLLTSLPFPQSVQVSLLQGRRQSISAAGTVGLWQAVCVVWVKRRVREFNIVVSIKNGSTLLSETV